MLLDPRALESSARRILESEISCGISVVEGSSLASFNRKRTEKAHLAIYQLASCYACDYPIGRDTDKTYPKRNPCRIEMWPDTARDLK